MSRSSTTITYVGSSIGSSPRSAGGSTNRARRVDARLPDGSRVNAVIEPLSLVGPVITIRKFSARPYTVRDLIRFGTGTPEIFDFLRMCILARLNVFVSGGTGSGKTTFLNVLSSFIPKDERIVTIEDAAELQLRQEHVVTLEARPANAEGYGEITIRDLLRNALHMRPDRIIVGECRSAEALDMIQAMMTGQDGSLSTGHANTTQDMLRRLETMILMSGYELPLRAIREQIASAVDVIVHTARLKDGTRKIVNITEVYGIEEDEILTHDIFAFDQTDFVDGKVIGELKPTGIRPTFMGVIREHGPRASRAVNSGSRRRTQTGRRARARPAGPSARRSRPWTSPGRTSGLGRAVKAGGMVYVTSVGPINPARASASSRRHPGAGPAVPEEPEDQARGGRHVAREGCLGELVAQGSERVRRLQRRVDPLVPGRRSGRAGHPDVGLASTRGLPDLDRRDRRGIAEPPRPPESTIACKFRRS